MKFIKITVIKLLSISDRKIIKKIKINKKIINQKERNYIFNSNILNSIFGNKRFYKVNGIAIDSRDVKKNNIFLAIKGKNNDGNKYINQAVRKGASYIITSKK